MARGRLIIALAALGLLVAACSNGAGAESEDGAFEGVTMLSPEHGADVAGTTVVVEIDPGSIDPTGQTVEYDYGGRFHLLVDRDCVANGDPLPIGEPGHYVFPQGSTELAIELPPGAHELCVQFGNAFDLAFYAEDTALVRVLG